MTNRVKELRASKLTQKALADQMTQRGRNWTRATVAHVENGRRRLTEVEVADLAELFAVPASDVLVNA